jgi:sugar phosphate isomerase/epimerase
MNRDFAGTIARVAAIGYKEVEFAGYFGHSPKEVREILQRYDLTAPAGHFEYGPLRSQLTRLIEDAHVIGHDYIVCPEVDEQESSSLEDWKRIAETFNRFGLTCKQAGVQFAYHNHDSDFTPVQGKLPYDVLLAETDSRLVQLEMDLYWITKAGHDPLTYFAKYPGRFPMVHVKDMDHTSQRGQTDVGKGIIDFRRIFQQADKAGIRHFFVEHDEPAAPLKSIRASYEYMRTMRF